MRILLIEDAPETRASLKLQLESLKFVTSVTPTEDGEDALLQIDLGGEFDLILSDWHMKPMDGLQFCVVARRHLDRLGRPLIPIVIVTADSRVLNPADRTKALGPAHDIGIVDIMAKPTTLADLNATLGKYVKAPS